MEIERPRASPAAVVVVGALAVFGLVALIQWVLGAVLGIVKFVLFVVVVVALIGLLLGRKARP